MVRLIRSFADTLLVELLQLCNLAPIVLPLKLQNLDFLIEISGLKAKLYVHISLLGIVLVQAKALEMTIVKKALLS